MSANMRLSDLRKTLFSLQSHTTMATHLFTFSILWTIIQVGFSLNTEFDIGPTSVGLKQKEKTENSHSLLAHTHTQRCF